MSVPSLPDRTRRFVIAFLAVCGGALIVTSGPRTVQGRNAEVEAPPQPAPSEAASPDIVAPPADDPPEVLWDMLAGLNYMSGEIAPELAEFVGKEVRIPGFMVPLEDFSSEVSEFLLVPYVGACVHTPPPPPNQLVDVEMSGEERVPVTYWDPIWIHGTLEVEETTNMYGSVSFKLAGTKLEPYEW